MLLSGGMDSATVLALALRECDEVRPLTLLYGQRHGREVESARAIARHFGCPPPVVVRLPIGPLLRSALTDRSIAVPARRGRSDRIPLTYVPARNTIFLSLALGFAETHDLDRIYLGVNAVDYSGYPDCRPEFLRAFSRLAKLATRSGVEGGRAVSIRAPLLRRSKADIVRIGERLRVPWELTWSCYRGGTRPCGRCDACRLRAKGFRDAGRRDALLLPKGRPVGRYQYRSLQDSPPLTRDR